MSDTFQVVKDYEVVSLERLSGTYLIRMKHDQNKFNDRFIDAFEDALCSVLADPNAVCLITTGHLKFYSTGLDLQWISEQQTKYPTFLDEFTQRFYALLGRVMSFPLPTIAAISGHAIGAGAFFSLVHDFRIMRRHRGSFAIPLARVHFPLTDSLRAILGVKVADPRVLRDLVLFSRRLTPVEALNAGIVDQVLGQTANPLSSITSTSSPISDSQVQVQTTQDDIFAKSSMASDYASGIQFSLPEHTSVPSQNFAENEEIVQASMLLYHQIPSDLKDRHILASLKECIFAEPLKTLRRKKVLNPMRAELGFVQRVYANSEADQSSSPSSVTMGASSVPEDIVSSLLGTPVTTTHASHSSSPQNQASNGTSGPNQANSNSCNQELSQEECSRLKPARLYSSSHL